MFSRERDKRGKEADPDRTERMQFPAAIAVVRETATVPFEIGLNSEVCFLQCLTCLEVGKCSCCPFDTRLQPANQPAINIMRLTFCIFYFRNGIIEAFDLLFR